MNCLIVSETRQECAECSAVIRPGIVALTESLAGRPVPLSPVCPECLKSRDARLAAAWAMIRDFGRLAALDQHIRPPQWPLPGE